MDEIDTLFNCFFCNYNTNKKSNYDKHLLTSKHKVNCGELSHKEYLCETCNKHFNSSNSLWKHNSRSHPITNDEDKINKLTNLVVKVVEQNSYLSKQICQLATNTNNNINSHNNTTNNNNRFNINVYLNETCKNAMNIKDFMDSIQLDLTDLINVGEVGYIKGISDIITTNLNALSITDRPIHCSDGKREVLYIKNEDKWEKDENKNKLKMLIRNIALKNQNLILKFKEKYPDCVLLESQYCEQYNRLIIEAMGGNGDDDLAKEQKIIKNITKNITLNKQELTKIYL
jgi:hypothetical protein